MDSAYGISVKVRLLLLAIAMVIIGFTVLAIVSAGQNKGRVDVEVITAPKQAGITIDGKKAGRGSSLKPGTYTFVVSYSGFSAYTEKVILKEGDKKRTLAVALAPQSSDARSLAAAQLDQYTAVENLGGQNAQADSEDFLKNNPLLENIPVKTSYYSIDYGKDAAGNIVIQITAGQPLGRQVALEKIRSWGFDPTDYRIVFVGLSNPFNKVGD